MFANIVTISKALVTRSDALVTLVPNSFLLLVIRCMMIIDDHIAQVIIVMIHDMIVVVHMMYAHVVSWKI